MSQETIKNNDQHQIPEQQQKQFSDSRGLQQDESTIYKEQYNNVLTSKDSQDMLNNSQNRLHSGRDSQHRNTIITSKIKHTGQLAETERSEHQLETVPGITNDAQIQKFEKPKSGGGLVDSARRKKDMVVYKDVSHRANVRDQKIKKVSGPVLARHLQSKGNQGSSDLSEKQDSVKTRHANERKLERVESEYPPGGFGSDQQHAGRDSPELQLKTEEAPVISIFPKSMDVAFVKENQSNGVSSSQQENQRQAIPIQESNKQRYKSREHHDISTGSNDQASKSTKPPQAKSVKNMKKSNQLAGFNSELKVNKMQVSPQARLLGVNQHHMQSLQTMAFGMNSSQSQLPQLRDSKQQDSGIYMKNTHGLLNQHYNTSGRLGQNIPLKQPYSSSSDQLQLAGQSINFQSTNKFNKLKLQDINYNQLSDNLTNDHMRISQNQSVENSHFYKTQNMHLNYQSNYNAQKQGHVLNQNSKISIPNIMGNNAMQVSSIFDSPDPDKPSQIGNPMMQGTQYKILISEGQGSQQSMADIHRVTASGQKYQITVDRDANISAVREKTINSTQSAYLKPNRSNTHSSIKRNFQMQNRAAHDNILKGVLHPMPLENKDAERNKLSSDNQSEMLYYVKIQNSSNSLNKKYQNSLISGTDINVGMANNVRKQYQQNYKGFVESSPTKSAMTQQNSKTEHSRFHPITKKSNVYVMDPSHEKPISVQISQKGKVNVDKIDQNSSRNSKLSQSGKEPQKSNTDLTRTNFEQASIENKSVHKRVDSLFENAEKAMRAANNNSKLGNQQQTDAAKQDMNIKVNNSQANEDKTFSKKPEQSSIGPFGSEEKLMLTNSNYQIPPEKMEGVGLTGLGTENISRFMGANSNNLGDMELSKKIVKDISVISPTIQSRQQTEKELENTIARFIKNNLPDGAQSGIQNDKYLNAQLIGQSYYGLNQQQNNSQGLALSKSAHNIREYHSRNGVQQAFSQSHASFQKLKAMRNNPAGHQFDQNKLLEIIKKQQENISVLRKTIERLEKDVSRFKSQLHMKKSTFNAEQSELDKTPGGKRIMITDQMMSSDASRFNSDGYNTLSNGHQPTMDTINENQITEVERILIMKGLDIEEGLQTFRKYVGQLKQDIFLLQEQGAKKEATIKRYRRLMNETLERRKNNGSRDLLSQTHTFNQTALPFDQISRSKPRDLNMSPQMHSNANTLFNKKKVSIDQDRFGLKQMKHYISQNALRHDTHDITAKQHHELLANDKKYFAENTKANGSRSRAQEKLNTGELSENNANNANETTPNPKSTSRQQEDRLPQHDSIHDIAHFQSRQEKNMNKLSQQFGDNQRQSPAISQNATSVNNTTNVGKSTVLNQQSRQVVLTTFNHTRMAKLMSLVQNIWKAKDFAKVMHLTLENLTHVFSCNAGIFVVTDSALMNNQTLRNSPDLIQTTQYVENTEITVVQSANMLASKNDPAFLKMTDASTPIFTAQLISYPIVDNQNKLLATIQIESRKIGGAVGNAQTIGQEQSLMGNHVNAYMETKLANPYQNQNQRAVITKNKSGMNVSAQKLQRDESTGKISDNSRNRNARSEGINAGFPMIDQHTICLLSTILSLKFDQLQSQKMRNDMQQEVIHTIELAGIICTQRSQPELVRLLKKHLPIYFGFQGVGILLKDQKSDLMFTLNELDDDSQGDKRIQLDDLDHKNGNGPKKTIEEMDATERAIRYRDLRKMEKITIPGSLGMSGVASTSGQIQFTNSPDTEKNFQKDVDNQAGINNVKNILVGPVYGHRNEYLQDLHPEVRSKAEIEQKKKSLKYVSALNQPDKEFKEIDHCNPIGIIQLINKNQYRDITDYDKRKFEAIQNLIGLSIDNTQEYNSIINIRLGMYHSMRGIIDGLKQITDLQLGSIII